MGPGSQNTIFAQLGMAGSRWLLPNMVPLSNRVNGQYGAIVQWEVLHSRCLLTIQWLSCSMGFCTGGFCPSWVFVWMGLMTNMVLLTNSILTILPNHGLLPNRRYCTASGYINGAYVQHMISVYDWSLSKWNVNPAWGFYPIKNFWQICLIRSSANKASCNSFHTPTPAFSGF